MKRHCLRIDGDAQRVEQRVDERKAMLSGRNVVDLKASVLVGRALELRTNDLHDRAGERYSAVNAVDDASGDTGRGALLSGSRARGAPSANQADDGKTNYDRGTHATVFEEVTGSRVEPP